MHHRSVGTANGPEFISLWDVSFERFWNGMVWHSTSSVMKIFVVMLSRTPKQEDSNRRIKALGSIQDDLRLEDGSWRFEVPSSRRIRKYINRIHPESAQLIWKLLEIYCFCWSVQVFLVQNPSWPQVTLPSGILQGPGASQRFCQKRRILDLLALQGL